RSAGNGRGLVVAGIVTVFLVGAAGGAIYYLSNKDSSPGEQQTNGGPDDGSDTINVKRDSGKHKKVGSGALTHLPPEKQKQVNEAIDKGVIFLRQTQGEDGRWAPNAKALTDPPGRFSVGYTALPALTLLECGVKKDDPAIQKAATFVRKNLDKLNDTYNLSLAILFL